MLSLVDDFIKTRLEKVKFNYGTGSPAVRSVQVYPYVPDRTKGHTEYPSYAIERFDVDVRLEDKRPDFEVFYVDTELDDNDVEVPKQITVTLPLVMGGGTVTGNASYIRKPFPSPVNITYEINTLATSRAHSDFLVEMLFQTFPPGFQSAIPGISDQYALFVMSNPICLDDPEKPEYRNAFVFKVYDLWIDRVEHWTDKSIASLLFDIEDVGGN